MSSDTYTPMRTAALVGAAALCCAVMMFKFDIVGTFVAAVALACLAAFLWKPEWAAATAFFMLYANIAAVGTRAHEVPPIMAAAVFGLFVLPILSWWLTHREAPHIDSVFLLMLLHLAAVVVSALVSRDPSASTERITGFALEGIALYWLVLNTVRTRHLLRLALAAMLAAGALMGSISLVQAATGTQHNNYMGMAQMQGKEAATGEIGEGGERITVKRAAGPIGETNRYAQVLVVLLPIALALGALARTRVRQLLSLGAGALCMAGIMLTFSRGAGLAIVVLAVTAMLVFGMRVKYILASMMAVTLIALVVAPGFVSRVSSVVDVAGLFGSNQRTVDSSIRGRATENLAALKILMDHPLTGVGAGQTRLYIPEYANDGGLRRIDKTRRAHSMVLEELSDTGVLGFSLFVLVIAAAVRQLVAARRLSVVHADRILFTALLFSLAAYLITAAFLHLSYMRYFYVLLGVCGAAARLVHEPVLVARPSRSTREHAAAGV